MYKDNLSAELEEPKKRTCYTIKLTSAQMKKLKAWCDYRLWTYYEVDYADFAFKGDKVNVVGYKSGKVVVQGKKTEDFVTYVLEAEITHSPQMGYDQVHHPEWFEPHAGLDESGKGDLFGPLVTACVIADGEMVEKWMEEGIRDSKQITSDKAIITLDKIIRGTKSVVVKTTWASMEKYNELYYKLGANLNKLLAWMHARALKDALQVRKVEWGNLDQFSEKALVQNYFKGESFELRMQVRAESDPVVAAASIVARAEYIRQMKKLSDKYGEKLLRGCGPNVKEQAINIVKKLGKEELKQFAKMHFKTATQVLYAT